MAGLSTRVKLSFEAQKLKSMDWTSKSDPMVVLFAVDPSGAQTMLGNTEMLKDNADPKFQTCIETEYHFEKKQKLIIKVLDVDKPGTPLAPGASQEIGHVETTMSKVPWIRMVDGWMPSVDGWMPSIDMLLSRESRN